MEAKGWTLTELARELGISENTVTQRLHVKDIDPLFRGSIYPLDTLERIREAPMGRPPKKSDKQTSLNITAPPAAADPANDSPRQQPRRPKAKPD